MVLVCKDTEERAMVRVSPKNTVEHNSTVLRIRLHCDGCIKKARKAISKFKGVEMVSPDSSKDLVTVKGTMNVEELVSYLRQKLKRNVEVVAAVKKEKVNGGSGGVGEKKGKESSNLARGEGDKREKHANNDSGGGDGSRKEESGGGCDSALKTEFYDGYAYYESAQENRQSVTALFSDENPNACSIM